MPDVLTEFSVVTFDGRTFSENDLTGIEPGAAGPYDRYSGAVSIRMGDARLDIGDSLGYAIYTLSTEILPSLNTDAEAVYECFDHEEEFTFVRQGDRLTISSAFGTSLSLPADDALMALLETCKRYSSTVQTFWPDVPQSVLDELKQNIAMAAEALGES